VLPQPIRLCKAKFWLLEPAFGKAWVSCAACKLIGGYATVLQDLDYSFAQMGSSLIEAKCYIQVAF